MKISIFHLGMMALAPVGPHLLHLHTMGSFRWEASIPFLPTATLDSYATRITDALRHRSREGDNF